MGAAAATYHRPRQGVVLLVGSTAWGAALAAFALASNPWLGLAFLVVAGVAPTREAVLPVGSIVIVTMAAVGGCWWPIDLEPGWMRTVALAFPTTWAMDVFNDLMLRGRRADAVHESVAVLFAHGAAYLAVGLVLFRRRYSKA